MYTYKHQWTKSTDNPRSKDQNRHFPLFHAHLELSFTLRTPTCLPSYSVLIEKLHIPTQTSQNLQHFGLDIIKTLQAPRGLKLVPIEENAQTAVILMQMYTEMSLQHSVLAQFSWLVNQRKHTGSFYLTLGIQWTLGRRWEHEPQEFNPFEKSQIAKGLLSHCDAHSKHRSLQNLAAMESS